MPKAGGARESVSSQFLVTIELDVKASNFSLFVVNFNIKSYFDELSEGGLKIFDNGGNRERPTWTGSPKGERMGIRESISAAMLVRGLSPVNCSDQPCIISGL